MNPTAANGREIGYRLRAEGRVALRRARWAVAALALGALGVGIVACGGGDDSSGAATPACGPGTTLKNGVCAPACGAGTVFDAASGSCVVSAGGSGGGGGSAMGGGGGSAMGGTSGGGMAGGEGGSASGGAGASSGGGTSAGGSGGAGASAGGVGGAAAGTGGSAGKGGSAGAPPITAEDDPCPALFGGGVLIDCSGQCAPVHPSCATATCTSDPAKMITWNMSSAFILYVRSPTNAPATDCNGCGAPPNSYVLPVFVPGAAPPPATAFSTTSTYVSKVQPHYQAASCDSPAPCIKPTWPTDPSGLVVYTVLPAGTGARNTEFSSQTSLCK